MEAESKFSKVNKKPPKRPSGKIAAKGRSIAEQMTGELASDNVEEVIKLAKKHK